MKTSILNGSAMLLCVLSFSLLMTSCDPLGIKSSGEVITLNFDEQDFEGLDLRVPAETEVRVGDAFEVEISCEETAMPHVETRVENGILKIYFDEYVRDVDHMKVVVTAPSWRHFEIDGSGDIQVADSISGTELLMDVSGSGSIRANDVYFDRVKLHVSGSGDLRLGGTTDKLWADISGSGEIFCFGLEANTVDVEVSGSGDVQVTAQESLTAQVSGSGDVVYKGNPLVNAHVSGSGSVRKY
ncbi:MAG: DUF2807 domain-containing protein [Saprospiraceae bacterium]|nr:DUF2807 domain-containing protein [Saprospiraceae bacterium]